ncbi:MAG: DMT family transporter [Galactobacter sp.]
MIVSACLLALISAAALAVGTHLQHRGVALAMAAASEPGRPKTAVSLGSCLRTPLWLLGTAVVVTATVLNVVALAMAPVALVQPLGVFSLVVAAVISARTFGLRVPGPLLAGILACVVGVGVFVAGSSTVVRVVPMSSDTAWGLAGLLACALLAAALVLFTRAGHLLRVVVSGVLFGMVAVSVHSVAPILARLVFGQRPDGSASAGSSSAGAASAGTESLAAGFQPPGLTVMVILVALICAVTAVGAWLVQTAYASGPPETVLAGLTVLDPLVAVLVGATLLHEYALPSPAVTVMLVAAAVVAVIGIVTVVRHHPGVNPGVNPDVNGKSTAPPPRLRTETHPGTERWLPADTTSKQSIFPMSRSRTREDDSDEYHAHGDAGPPPVPLQPQGAAARLRFRDARLLPVPGVLHRPGHDVQRLRPPDRGVGRCGVAAHHLVVGRCLR